MVHCHLVIHKTQWTNQTAQPKSSHVWEQEPKTENRVKSHTFTAQHNMKSPMSTIINFMISVHKEYIYRIVGNFCRRKLLQIGGKKCELLTGTIKRCHVPKFHRGNFRKFLNFAKVFSLESVLLYSMLWCYMWSIVDHATLTGVAKFPSGQLLRLVGWGSNLAIKSACFDVSM